LAKQTNKQTDTDRPTDRQTGWSQYFAPATGGEVLR